MSLSGPVGTASSTANWKQLSSTEQVFQDLNLLYCISRWLTPRGKIAFSVISRACAMSVDVADFWRVIHGSINQGDNGARKAYWSYSEAAQYGNRLGCVLRKYGRYCERLYLANSVWLQVTGLEDLAR